jgi:hydrogenase-4 membrane subunit HyfE
MRLPAGVYDALGLITELLSFSMVLMALGISTVKTVRHMIPLYKIQSYILAGVTLLTSVAHDESGRLVLRNVVIFLILPIFLAISVEPLLAQATVPEDIPVLLRLRHLFLGPMRSETRQRAIPIWLEQHPFRLGEVASLTYSLIFVLIAYSAAFLLGGKHIGQQNNLAIPIALLLLGLFTMSNKQAIISQIMGLLVMEHGLFLAAVKVIPIPDVAIVFVISLFFYTIITLMILLFLLPELHNVTGSIQVEDQQELKG